MKVIRSAIGSMASWGLIKELRKVGVEVIGIDADPFVFDTDLVNYGYLLKGYVVPRGDSSEFLDIILSIIKKEHPNAILSGPEEELLALSRNRDLIEEQSTVLLCPDYKSVDICSDKKKTYKVLEHRNVPIPEIYHDPYSITYPCIIKPQFGRGSSNVFKVNDREELIFYAKRVSNPIIQEYVAGNEYTVDILADRSGAPLSVVPRLRLGTESGITIRGRTVYDKEIISYCKQIVKELELFGPSCIQCIRNDKCVKFIDINPRFGGGAILSLKADPTIIPNLIRLINGEKPEPNEKFREGLTMLRYYSEVFV